MVVVGVVVFAVVVVVVVVVVQGFFLVVALSCDVLSGVRAQRSRLRSGALSQTQTRAEPLWKVQETSLRLAEVAVVVEAWVPRCRLLINICRWR